MEPAPTASANQARLGDQLAEAAYLRIRQRPRRRDGDYISLCDVQRIVLRTAPDFRGDVYDYGCGGAPYADLFRGCRSYVKADVVPGPLVDRLLGEDGMTGEGDGLYDWVFSTQVLEHVPDPARYLRECWRILRPGGEVLLTTHGFYPEHGCPYDFHRWTAECFLREIRAAGFQVVEGGKLSVGVRGSVQMMHHCVWNLRSERGGLRELLLGAFRKMYGWVAVPALNWLADRFPEQAEGRSDASSTLYIGVYARARKPDV
jgi:SAM-dependent methyltransferase